MAARPKSGITADTDVNLDFLTKEEKEALLSKKMDMIRQRNKALTERHKIIEADKKKAEEAGQAVKPTIDSQSLPAEGAPKPRGRGRGQRDREANRPAKERPKSSGDFRDSSNYEPFIDTTDLASHRGKGRGGQYDRDAQNNTPKNKRKPPPKEENVYIESQSFVKGNHSGQRHPNRRHDDGPPPDPSFNPLADRRRSDRKEEPTDHKRHPRNYGGGADLAKVKQSMKNLREKEKERPPSNKPIEIVMTGKERKNHEEWKAERERYDKERIQRQLNEAGTWKRAWDADKIPQEYDADIPTSRLEPAKRPAGRIGSGRFDRGERDDRPRSAVIGKGGLQIDHSQQQPSPPHHPQVGDSNNKAPRGRGRGRGKGRGRGNGPGEKSPRPRTWSGGDDRFVECQKELLLVKFDNTAGDNSVEVEYDDMEIPISPPSTPKSSNSSTTPGRGPTGRTPNQASSKQHQGRGGKPQQQKNKAPRHKGKPQAGSQHHVVSTEEDWDAVSPTSPQINLDPSALASSGYPEETRVRTSSHSQSYGDSEEWEDCTESSGMQEEDDYINVGLGGLSDPGRDNTDLHLQCKLNPEAPEFLPTSPDFMKTPPGHVKVLNWAADGSPTSPLSQGSVTSPQPLNQSASPLASPRPPAPTTKSPVSSPGSSASVKAARRREEVDMMPEGDQPHPPPFLLAQDDQTFTPPPDVQSAPESKGKQEANRNEEDDDENFEDSIDDVQAGDKEIGGEEECKQPPQTTEVKTSPSAEKSAAGSTAPPSQAGSSAPAKNTLEGQEKEVASGKAVSHVKEGSTAEGNVPLDLATELAQASASTEPEDAPVEPATDLASELAEVSQIAKDLSKETDPARDSSDVANDVVSKSDIHIDNLKEASDKESSEVPEGTEPPSSFSKDEVKELCLTPQSPEEANGPKKDTLESGDHPSPAGEAVPDSPEASSKAGSKSSPIEEESASPTADISASS